MKTKLLVLLFLFLSINIFSQYKYIKSEDIKLIDGVQTKLRNDSIAYEHFLFVKKCLCYDKIDKKVSVSNDVLKWMHNLGYPLYIMLDMEKIQKTINVGLNDEINIKRKQLGKRNEKFYETSNKFIVCESIASETIRNKNQFLSIVNDINNFDRYKYKSVFENYLNNIRYSNEFWSTE